MVFHLASRPTWWRVGPASTVIGDDVDLLVVGGPTHAFGMSRPGARQTAAGQGEHGPVSAGIGLREWLDALEDDLTAWRQQHSIRVSRNLTGSWVRPRARSRSVSVGSASASLLLRKNFYVAGTPGPLLNGEAARARRWGETLASEFSAKDGGRRVS